MAIKITCPYCFREFNDNQVHFRSSYVNTGARKIAGPDGQLFDSISEMEMSYGDEDKAAVAQIVHEYKESSFYNPVLSDKEYDAFWKKFGDTTTEVDSVNKDRNKKLMYRKVIDPSDIQHQKHLVKQKNGDYLIRDPELKNMVTSIRLIDGDKSQTSMRVCPFCHNPLPDVYGLYPVEFISVIGIVGSGKTVFLSQFMNGFRDYAAECGLTAIKSTASITQFLENNRVKEGMPLPQPTAEGRFEQPLIYNIERTSKNNSKETVTIVMYDIAGEVFKNAKAQSVKDFAPFIKKSDGIILLIDPKQFESIQGTQFFESSNNQEDIQKPSDALENIHSVIMESDHKYDKPLAVCVSKMDGITEYLSRELIDYISTPYTGEEIKGTYLNKQIFNMQAHKAYDRAMAEFIAHNDKATMQQLSTGYTNYKFFGITALGLNAEVMADKKVSGHIQARRIEEPILWMLSQVGLIGSNEAECPYCHQRDAFVSHRSWNIQIKKEIETKKLHFISKKEEVLVDVEVNCRCKCCGIAFYYDAYSDQSFAYKGGGKKDGGM